MSNSFPPSFVESIPLNQQDKLDLLESLNQPSPNSIRTNPYKAGSVLMAGRKVAWAKHGRYLNERPSYTMDPHFHAGAYYPQEASSMFLSHIIEQLELDKKALKVLDLCSAPGGKASLLSAELHPDSFIVANEVISSRNKVLQENLSKWGIPNYAVTQSDPKEFSQLPGFFDLIVVDAPCSGEGMFRKHLYARDEWSEKNVELCCQRQRRILADVWPALRPGGKLIYSTCTFNERENEENLEWLNREFEASGAASFSVPEGVVKTEVKGIAGYRFFPHKTEGEGFFVAVVEKTAGREYKAGKSKKPEFNSAEKSLPQELKQIPQEIFSDAKGTYFAGAPDQRENLNLLTEKIRILLPGQLLGSMLREQLIASNSIAYLPSVTLFEEIPVDIITALGFLSLGQLNLHSKPRGYYTLTFKGIPIGVVKSVGSRFNNLYPKGWRILNSKPELYQSVITAL